MTFISPLRWTIPLQEEWWSLGAAALVLAVVRSGENSRGHAVADDLCVKPASVVTRYRFETPDFYQSRMFTSHGCLPVTDVDQTRTFANHGCSPVTDV